MADLEARAAMPAPTEDEPSSRTGNRLSSEVSCVQIPEQDLLCSALKQTEAKDGGHQWSTAVTLTLSQREMKVGYRLVSTTTSLLAEPNTQCADDGDFVQRS